MKGLRSVDAVLFVGCVLCPLPSQRSHKGCLPESVEGVALRPYLMAFGMPHPPSLPLSKYLDFPPPPSNPPTCSFIWNHENRSAGSAQGTVSSVPHPSTSPDLEHQFPSDRIEFHKSYAGDFETKRRRHKAVRRVSAATVLTRLTIGAGKVMTSFPPKTRGTASAHHQLFDRYASSRVLQVWSESPQGTGVTEYMPPQVPASCPAPRPTIHVIDVETIPIGLASLHAEALSTSSMSCLVCLVLPRRLQRKKSSITSHLLVDAMAPGNALSPTYHHCPRLVSSTYLLPERTPLFPLLLPSHSQGGFPGQRRRSCHPAAQYG